MTEVDILALESSAHELRDYIARTSDAIKHCEALEDSVVTVWHNRLGVRRRIRYWFLLRKARYRLNQYRAMKTTAAVMLERVLSTAERLAKGAV
jgi:hypothetical protein